MKIRASGAHKHYCENNACVLQKESREETEKRGIHSK